MEKYLINFNHVSKTYKHKNIISDISFTLYQDEALGIIGDNGSGKSTLMKLISHISHTTLGKIGTQLKDDDIGYLIEEPAFYPELTGLDNIKYYAIQRRNLDINYIEKLFTEFEMGKFKNKKFSTYSLGTKKKLALVLAFLNKPKLLILDEPFSGLDATSSEAISKKLTQLKNNEHISIVITSHQLSEIYFICTRFIFIYSGKIIGNIKKSEWDTIKKNMGKYLFNSKNELLESYDELVNKHVIPEKSIFIDSLTNTIKVFNADIPNIDNYFINSNVITDEVNLNDYYYYLKESYKNA